METVVITGASSGIGFDAAGYLGQRGFRVFAGVRKNKDAERVRAFANVEPVFLDVTKDESCAEAVTKIQAELARAERVHLVNNAGIALGGPVEGLPLAKWKEQFEVNVFGVVRASQAFLPFIRKSRGRIVNISSVSGLVSAPYLGPYSASKFALESISDALRRELRQFGVSVSLIEPGPIATPIWEKSLSRREEVLSALTSEARKVYGKELEHFFQEAARSEKSAAPVRLVSLAIEKALRQARPRTRYVVGGQGIGVAQWLPDRVVDAVVARTFRK